MEIRKEPLLDRLKAFVLEGDFKSEGVQDIEAHAPTKPIMESRWQVSVLSDKASIVRLYVLLKIIRAEFSQINEALQAEANSSGAPSGETNSMLRTISHEVDALRGLFRAEASRIFRAHYSADDYEPGMQVVFCEGWMLVYFRDE